MFLLLTSALCGHSLACRVIVQEITELYIYRTAESADVFRTVWCTCSAVAHAVSIDGLSL
jgi:hypothetical protein